MENVESSKSPVPLTVNTAESGVDAGFIGKVTGVAEAKFSDRPTREMIDGKVVTFLPSLNAVVIRTDELINSGQYKNCYKGLFVPIDKPQMGGWVADLETKSECGPKTLKEARDEYTLLEGLPKHPNIDRPLAVVDTYSLGKEAKHVGAISLLADGDANDIVVTDLTEKITLCRDLALGYGVLHENGIVHGDGKPANVLVTRTGGEISAKVTDFGLSYPASEAGERLAKRITGTEAWIPAEIWDLEEGAGGTERDTWALLATAYQIQGGYREEDEKTGRSMLAEPEFAANFVEPGPRGIEGAPKTLAKVQMDEGLEETLYWALLDEDNKGPAEIEFQKVIAEGLLAPWNERPTAKQLAKTFDDLLAKL